MAMEIGAGLNKTCCSGNMGIKYNLLSPAISGWDPLLLKGSFPDFTMKHLDDGPSHYHRLQLTEGGPISSRLRQRQHQAAAPSSPGRVMYCT